MEKNSQGSYYEAILQIRNPTEEVVNCVMNAIKKQKDVFISREINYKTGFDLFISSQKFAHQLGRVLKKSFRKGSSQDFLLKKNFNIFHPRDMIVDLQPSLLDELHSAGEDQSNTRYSPLFLLSRLVQLPLGFGPG